MMRENPEAIAEQIQLNFTRADLEEVLKPKNYSAEALVALFRNGMEPPILQRYAQPGFANGAAHALAVLKNFDHYFYNPYFIPGGVRTDFFRVFLVLHDIGYPIEGSHRQHSYTPQMIEAILNQLEFPEEEIKIAKTLGGTDPIGHYMRDTSEATEAHHVIDQMMTIATNAGYEVPDELEDFHDLILLFFKCDAGSYSGLIEHKNDEKIKFKAYIEEGIRRLNDELMDTIEEA